MGHPHRMIWYGWCQSDIRPVSHLRASVSQRQAERHWLLRAKMGPRQPRAREARASRASARTPAGGIQASWFYFYAFYAACVTQSYTEMISPLRGLRDTVVDSDGLSRNPIPRIPGPNPVNRRHPVGL